MNTAKTTEFFKTLAKERGISVTLVREIARSEFEFLAHVMKSGDRDKLEFESVMLPKFGKFTPTPGAISKIKYLRQGKLKKYGTTELGKRKVRSVTGKPDDIRV